MEVIKSVKKANFWEKVEINQRENPFLKPLTYQNSDEKSKNDNYALAHFTTGKELSI